MNNSKDAVDVPLSTFGGLSTELSPRDIPEGGSPDNQDVRFVPGSVLTREGLARLHAAPIPDSSATVYEKTLVKQDGTKINLYLKASGKLYKEAASTPGVFTLVASVAAASKCKSVPAFGKEWMVFSDGLHGTDIPRWFDGDNWGRISQGGPCANAQFAETIAAPSGLSPVGAATPLTVVSAVSANPATYPIDTWVPGYLSGYTWVDGYWQHSTGTLYGTIDVTVTSTVGIAVGNAVVLSGNTSAALNGRSRVVTAIVGLVVSLAYNAISYYTGTGGTLSVYAPTLTRSSGTVTAGTATAHGLVAGDMFTVSGVTPTTVGGTITAAARVSNVATFTTSTKHGIQSGNSLFIAGVTDTTFNGTWKVTAVVDEFKFQVTSSNLGDASSSGGTVTAEWNNTQRFVITVPNASTLTYADDGPDCFTTSTAGTIAPTGQIAGGYRNAVLMFQTSTGYITPPSNPVRLQMSGGKKLVASNVPTGPPNVVRRIFGFTAVNGGRWFYIGVPVRDAAGNVIANPTVINDNTSTSAVFDFSDTALMAGSGIDIDGNNLFNLKVLGNCATLGLYADRLFFGGDENAIPNLQNMGFEGGTLADGKPLGWTNAGGLVVNTNGDFGDALTLTAGNVIAQNAYRDYWGVEIVKPSTKYLFKCWAHATGDVTITADFYDTATATQLAAAQIVLTAASTIGFHAAAFSVATPASITATTVFRVHASAAVTVDEMSVIYADAPYNERRLYGSYVINPESVDGLSGVIGASSGDMSAIMDTFLLMDPRAITEESANSRLYFLTKNGLHTTKNLAGLEPANWAVNQIADKCGTDSMFSAVNGESWAAWASQDGARMFDGGAPRKVTQDIQDLWDTINTSAFHNVWSVNDPHARRVYWGVPIASTTPDRLIVLDYRYGESASDIEERASVKVSQYTGKMLVTDMSRKFTHWHVGVQCGAFLQTPHGSDLVFGHANGNSYYLDRELLHDDDFGVIPAYYVPAFSPTDEQEQALQLGAHRHLVVFLSIFIEGTGTLQLTPYRDSLSNAVNVARRYPLRTALAREMEIPQNVDGRRVSYKIEALPLAGSLDAHFDLSSMVLSIKPHPHSAVAGRA